MTELTVIPFISCAQDLPALKCMVVLAGAAGGIHFGHRLPCGPKSGGWCWSLSGSRWAKDAIIAWAPMIQHPNRDGL